MKELKPVDYALLCELMKDSRRSDRQLAKALRVSQPTVTRRRMRLEKDFLDGYTAIPRFRKIGFELVAFTFVKSRFRSAPAEQKDQAREKGKEFIMNQPNCIFGASGEGMNWDGVCISFHKSYSDFAEFKRTLKVDGSEFFDESESFVSVLSPRTIVKPFHFKYLSDAK